MNFSQLLYGRLSHLRLKRSQVVTALGYRNLNKGIRRLQELEESGFWSSKDQVRILVNTLQVGLITLLKALSATRRANRNERLQQEALAHENWVQSFVPHAFCIGDREIPSPIFVVAYMGADRILGIPFDISLPQQTWVEQILKVLPKQVPAFGNVIGFVINYAPDKAIYYDRCGNQVKSTSKPHKLGKASLKIGKALLFGN